MPGGVRGATRDHCRPGTPPTFRPLSSDRQLARRSARKDRGTPDHGREPTTHSRLDYPPRTCSSPTIHRCPRQAGYANRQYAAFSPGFATRERPLGSATRESTTPLQEFLHEEGRRLLPAERTPDDGQAPTTRNHPYLSARDVLVLRGRQAERLH